MTPARYASLIVTVLLLLTDAAAAASTESREPGTSVEMPYVIAPLIADDKLVAYAYVSCQIIATSPSAAIAIRARTAFIQDTFVRDVNGKPVAKPDQPMRVDTAALLGRLLRDAKREAGRENVAGIELIQVQIALLRPNAPT